VAPINGRNSASHEGESGQIAGKLVGGRESEAAATPGKMEVSETSSTKIPVHAQREHSQTSACPMNFLHFWQMVQRSGCMFCAVWIAYDVASADSDATCVQRTQVRGNFFRNLS